MRLPNAKYPKPEVSIHCTRYAYVHQSCSCSNTTVSSIPSSYLITTSFAGATSCPSAHAGLCPIDAEADESEDHEEDDDDQEDHNVSLHFDRLVLVDDGRCREARELRCNCDLAPMLP
jgi:hypothetical protein